MSDTQTIFEPNFSVNLLNAILWQYNNAPNVFSLLNRKQTWYNEHQNNFWSNWITNVFDLRTCNQFGITVWAIILGIPISIIQGGNGNTTDVWGFGPDTIGGTPNGNQNFFNGNFSATQTEQYNFTLQEQRIILQLRYRQMIARGTIPEVNKIFADILVPVYGSMYLVDQGNMVGRWVIPGGISAFLSFIFENFDLIPRPAGVKLLQATS
jgi:hypothetical protein